MANQKQNMAQPNSEEGSAAKYNHIKNVVAVMSAKEVLESHLSPGC
jgi:hypothetical protein